LNNTGRYCTYVGRYKVVQESKRFSGVYDCEHLITSATSWRKAIKLAKLLDEAYREGYENGQIDDISWG
jgi:hypothetical protein